MLATDQLRQITALLLRAAPAPDLVDAEIGVGAVAQAHRGRGAGPLLHRHHVLEIAQAQAAERLLDRDPVQAELAHGRPELAWKLVGPIDLGGERRDLVGGEPRCGSADGVGGFTEVEIKRWAGILDHSPHLTRLDWLRGDRARLDSRVPLIAAVFPVATLAAA